MASMIGVLIAIVVIGGLALMLFGPHAGGRSRRRGGSGSNSGWAGPSYGDGDSRSDGGGSDGGGSSDGGGGGGCGGGGCGGGGGS